MEDPKPSRLTRIKQRIKENEIPIAFGAGIGIGAFAILKFPDFFFEVKNTYNPAQPIPTIELTEDQIRRELLSGTMVSEFLKDRGLVKDLSKFGIEWFGAVNAAGTDRDAIRKAAGLAPGEYLDRLGELKLER